MFVKKPLYNIYLFDFEHFCINIILLSLLFMVLKYFTDHHLPVMQRMTLMIPTKRFQRTLIPMPLVPEEDIRNSYTINFVSNKIAVIKHCGVVTENFSAIFITNVQNVFNLEVIVGYMYALPD